MTENDWDACDNPCRLLESLPDALYGRQLRLFACACCRRIWRLVSDERLRHAVTVRELYEHGNATDEELEQSGRDARIARREIRAPFIAANADEYSESVAPGWAAGAAANAASGNYYAASDLAARAAACAQGEDWQRHYNAERLAQCQMLKSMVAALPGGY